MRMVFEIENLYILEKQKKKVLPHQPRSILKDKRDEHKNEGKG